jgi:hypothetical protein
MMNVWHGLCRQRGCSFSPISSEAPPINCPVCGNELSSVSQLPSFAADAPPPPPKVDAEHPPSDAEAEAWPFPKVSDNGDDPP